MDVTLKDLEESDFDLNEIENPVSYRAYSNMTASFSIFHLVKGYLFVGEKLQQTL